MLRVFDCLEVHDARQRAHGDQHIHFHGDKTLGSFFPWVRGEGRRVRVGMRMMRVRLRVWVWGGDGSEG